MRPWLSLDNVVLQDLLKIGRIVVFEGDDRGARQPTSCHQRSVVELIADDQTSLSYQGRYHRRVRPKAHSKYHCRLFVDEPRYHLFSLAVNGEGSELGARTVDTDGLRLETLRDAVGTLAMGLGKSQIVVRAEIVDLEFPSR